MQKINGADPLHETHASVAPHSVVVTDPKVLPADVLEKLKVPLPPEAVSPNPDKPGLSVIKVIYVVERLNDVFGLNGWRVVNQVVESGRMVVVKASSMAEMTIRTAAMPTRAPARMRYLSAPVIWAWEWTYTKAFATRGRSTSKTPTDCGAKRRLGRINCRAARPKPGTPDRN
jgi:hypothetical protein